PVQPVRASVSVERSFKETRRAPAPCASQSSASALRRTSTRTSAPADSSCLAAVDPTLPVAPAMTYIAFPFSRLTHLRVRQYEVNDGRSMPEHLIFLLIPCTGMVAEGPGRGPQRRCASRRP